MFVFIVVSVLSLIDFSMRVFVFLASGIVEDGAVRFFHMKLKVFQTRTVFSMRVFVFLVSGIKEDVLCLLK